MPQGPPRSPSPQPSPLDSTTFDDVHAPGEHFLREEPIHIHRHVHAASGALEVHPAPSPAASIDLRSEHALLSPATVLSDGEEDHGYSDGTSNGHSEMNGNGNSNGNGKAEGTRVGRKTLATLQTQKTVKAIPGMPAPAMAYRATSTRHVTAASKDQIKTVSYLGISFAIIFAAFNVCQSFLTTFFPTLGFLSIATIYAFFALGALVAPNIGQKFGIKQSIAVGGFTYVLFLLSISIRNGPLFILMSAVNGFGGGLLWVSEGIWMSRITEAGGSTGFFNGLFFTIFNLNGVTGNLVVLFVLSIGLATSIMVWMMVVICFCGCVMLLFAKKVETRKPDPVIPVVERLKHLWVVTKQPRTYLLAPYMFLQGLGLSFTFGVFPPLTDSSDAGIARLFLAYGITSMLMSLLAGRMFDKYGWRPIAVSHIVFVFGNFALIIYTHSGNFSSTTTAILYTIAAANFGMIDNITNSICNMTIIALFTDDPKPAFSIYRFIFCCGFSVGAFLGLAIPYKTLIVINVLFLLFTLKLYARLQERKEVDPSFTPSVKPADPHAETEEQQFKVHIDMPTMDLGAADTPYASTVASPEPAAA